MFFTLRPGGNGLSDFLYFTSYHLHDERVVAGATASNLLTTAPIDKNALSPDSRNNIDQVIDKSDGSITNLKNKAQSDDIVKPARMGAVTETSLKTPAHRPSQNIATFDNILSQKNTENSSNESAPLTVLEKPVVKIALEILMEALTIMGAVH